MRSHQREHRVTDVFSGWRGAGKACIAAALLLGGLQSVLVLEPSNSSAARARAARTVVLKDKARLHLIKGHGLRLYEKGFATGTVKGTLYLKITVTSTNRATAQVSIYPAGGSLTGTGTAKYQVRGAVASFSGSLLIKHGSGRYSHTRGSRVSFSGKIKRVSEAITVSVSGKLTV
jgi:hypothetical protein